MGILCVDFSEKPEASKVMPLYYKRQTIEQTFDFAQNDVALMPVRNHSDETFRGHLLLSFMATVMLIMVKRVVKTGKKLAIIAAVQALRSMRCIKCEVFPQALVTGEPGKYVNLIINELKLEIPGHCIYSEKNFREIRFISIEEVILDLRSIINSLKFLTQQDIVKMILYELESYLLLF